MTTESEKKLLEVLEQIKDTLDKKMEPQVGKAAGLLTSKQLAERWECSERKISDMKGAGKIPFVMIDGSLRFPLKEIELYEARNTIKPTGKASGY